jgi:hypothetical protein
MPHGARHATNDWLTLDPNQSHALVNAIIDEIDERVRSLAERLGFK